MNTEGFENRVRFAREHVDTPEAAQLAKELRPFIKMCGSTVPFSEAERASSLSELYSMVHMFGLPSWFITVSPDDAFSTLCIRLSRTDRNNKLDTEEAEIVKELKDTSLINLYKLVAENPVAAADEFQRIIYAMLEHLFQLPAHHQRKETFSFASRRAGIFGKLAAYFLVVETSGRTALHSHGVLWGSISPALLESIADNERIKKEARKVINSMVKAEIPAAYYKQLKEKRANNLPFRHGALDDPILPYAVFPQGGISKYADFTTSKACEDRVFGINAKVNNHEWHGGRCKEGKSGKYGCSLGMPQAIYNKDTDAVELTYTYDAQDKMHVQAEATIKARDYSKIVSDPEVVLQAPDKRIIIWELLRRQFYIQNSPDLTDFFLNPVI